MLHLTVAAEGQGLQHSARIWCPGDRGAWGRLDKARGLQRIAASPRSPHGGCAGPEHRPRSRRGGAGPGTGRGAATDRDTGATRVRRDSAGARGFRPPLPRAGPEDPRSWGRARDPAQRPDLPCPARAAALLLGPRAGCDLAWGCDLP